MHSAEVLQCCMYIECYSLVVAGDGAYGTGQVLLVRLDNDPFALTVDPSLYPMSQELLEVKNSQATHQETH